MKKLLLFIMTVLMLMVPSVLAADLHEFNITTPLKIWGGDSFDVRVEALDENGTIISDFSETVDIDWEAYDDSFALSHGEGNYTVASAPNGDFTITVSYNGSVSDSVDVTGLYYELTVSPSSVSETATENVTINVNEVLELENTGTEDINEIEVSYNGFEPSRATFTDPEDSLDSGDYCYVTFVYDVDGLTAGTYNGSIVIESNETDDITVPVTITVEEEEEEKILYIDEVEINGEKLSLSDYEDGDDLSINAKDIVGEDIEVVITIKNDGDEDMEDVDVDLTIENIDDGDDIDDDDTIDRINDGDEEELTFTFSAAGIDWDPDEDTYTVTIEIQGTGRESDDDFSDDWDFDMSVEREDDDVEITSAELEESTIEPGDTTYLNIEIANLGTDDQDEVVLSVESSALGIDYLDKNIELDEGDDYVVTIPVKALSSLKEGSYSIDIAVYYDWDEYNDEDPTDANKVTLVVEKFAAEEDEEEQESEEESGPGIIIPEQTIPQDIPTTEEISFRETTAYTVLLVLGSVLLVSMIVFLLMQIFRH